MTRTFEIPPDATPLSPEESDGLILKHLTTRAELDRWEQENISEAMDWLSRRRKTDVLTEGFIRRLHQKMFGRVWKWAGRFRSSDKNIGVYWAHIPAELKKLLDDTQYWIDHQTFSEEEIAARFHHHLVRIHLFSNGNGRHARLAADVLMKEVFGKKPFTWGGGRLSVTGDIRGLYIKALRAADENDYTALLDFVRS